MRRRSGVAILSNEQRTCKLSPPAKQQSIKQPLLLVTADAAQGESQAQKGDIGGSKA